MRFLWKYSTGRQNRAGNRFQKKNRFFDSEALGIESPIKIPSRRIDSSIRAFFCSTKLIYLVPLKRKAASYERYTHLNSRKINGKKTSWYALAALRLRSTIRLPHSRLKPQLRELWDKILLFIFIKYLFYLYICIRLPFASCSLKVIRSLIRFHEKVISSSFNEPVQKTKQQQNNSGLILRWNRFMLSTILSAARQNR